MADSATPKPGGMTALKLTLRSPYNLIRASVSDKTIPDFIVLTTGRHRTRSKQMRDRHDGPDPNALSWTSNTHQAA